MSLQKFNPVLSSLGLSMGAVFLVGNASAMAVPTTEIYISQIDDSTPPVVVDTEGTGTTTGTSTNGSSIPVPDTQTRFSCQLSNGEYTVMYQPESQPSQFFPWATPSALGGGWTEEKRCGEIARRLELYRPDGLLELTTGVENSYNTVCVKTERVPSCRIVFTVPPGQDPLVTRDRVFDNLTVADSGQQTDAIYTYRGGKNELDQLVNMGREALGGRRNSRTNPKNINLRPFLDRADGGTGTQLRQGVTKPSNSQKRGNSQLNPGSFR